MTARERSPPNVYSDLRLPRSGEQVCWARPCATPTKLPMPFRPERVAVQTHETSHLFPIRESVPFQSHAEAARGDDSRLAQEQTALSVAPEPWLRSYFP